jgi:exopolysaccharide production protein ExoZ
MPDPASKTGAPQHHLLGVQYLRAIAALMVAYFHTIDQIPEYRPYFETFLLGRLNLAAGVDIFFVISGFIMLLTNRSNTPGNFAVRRVIRIVPLYWILTAMLALLALWLPAQFRTTVVSVSAFAKSLLFIPYLNPGHPGEVFPLLVPGWSLNLEMFFYAVFALVLFAPTVLRLWIVGLIFGLLVLAGFVASGHGLPPELLFYTDMRLLEFWLGMLIGHCLLQGSVRLPSGLALGLIAAGFVMLLTGFPVNLFEPGNFVRNLVSNVLPAGAIILGTVALERDGAIGKHRWLHWLGDASYSIYLTHIFSLGLARFIWHGLGLERDGLAYVVGFALFGMLLVIAGAWLSYAAIETPSLQALQKLIRRRREPRPAMSSNTVPGRPR